MSGAAASSSTSGQKISSIFAAAAKSGFVIPKNKLSGSLVPVFPPKQQHITTNQLSLRKTKWAPDLTLDPHVIRAKALALKIRVDQITKQLESDESNSGPQINSKKSEMLELEKREAIGEILKLDPSYKPPPGFRPLLKEASVPLPVQEYPGYNFVGLIYGSEGNNQKRLEKETGAKIKLYGTKADTGEKGEIKPRANNKCSYEEMHVNVSADSFDKVDAAVSIIELLITSVTGNLAAGSAPAVSFSRDGTNVLSQSHDGPPSHAVSVSLENQAVGQSVAVSQMHGYHLKYSGPGFSAVPSHNPAFDSSGNIDTSYPSGFARTPNFPSQTLNPASMASAFGAQPGFLPIFPSQHVSMQAPPPRQAQQHANMTQASSLGHIGPPRNPSMIPVQNLSAPTNASPRGQLHTSSPLLPQAISPAPMPNQSLTPTRPLSLHQQPDVAFKLPQSNVSMMPRPSASPMPPQPSHSSGPVSFPSPGVSPSLPTPQQPGTLNSVSGVAPYHTNVKPLALLASTSGNFTFQSHRQNADFQIVSRPNSQAASQGVIQEPPSGPRPLPFGFPRSQVPNQVDQMQSHVSSVPFAGRLGSASFPPRHTAFPYAGQPALRSPAPRMGNFVSAPQMPNLPSPGVPRSLHTHHNYPAQRPWPMNQKFGSNHSMASGKPPYPADQIYDPFSPTSVVPPQHKGNP
ncbi:hypothetical protein RIF29_08578 [Crotalaria pallida]|uniref:K Homology domain-containing protein n=1 Tax=Crotalaria pallida TaxID=3830 RepID=A0AAN9FQY6_CROPI